ncbi:sensor histidine kinase [Paenibacillus sepulcri]|uniref:histidine kinase n=1 Tax=Paenibacillus sepulcri TaxID=359917 RepID=A0ABS7C924_9BACL|nr:sensor histidine kinase [Paenibacillus sepulcri]
MKLLPSLRERFMRMRFRTKLIFFYVLLISLPSIINGFEHYSTSSGIILDNSRDSILEIVKKNNEIIDIILSGIEERTLSLISDQDLYDLFNHVTDKSDHSLVQMDKKVTAILTKYFGRDQDKYTAQLVTSYYSFGGNAPSITTNSPFFSVSPEGFRSSDIYRRAIEEQGKLIWIPTYDYSSKFAQPELRGVDPKFKYMFSTARVINSAPIVDGVIRSFAAHVEKPVLLINFSETYYRDILKFSLPIKDSYMYVVSDKGEIVYHPDTAKLATLDTSGWLDAAFKAENGTLTGEVDGNEMLICFDTSTVTGWKTISVVPYKQLIRELPAIRYLDLILAGTLTLLAIVIAYILSGWLIKPIKKLLVAIHLTGTGDFSTKIPDQPDYEFNVLIKKFNHMNDKIQELIRENYEVTLREKEAEIMALNLQLNPHFLYNTLNIINWMAIGKDQQAISKMIVSLSNMLQYTVNNKQEPVRLKDDLIWLRGYTHIMEKRFDGVFTIQIEMDGLPEECKVPKLFLQPIIENAIIHGFEDARSGGLIVISGEESSGVLCFKVADNGKGMDKSTVQKLLDPQSDGIGIKNIEQRIKLLYGEDYGLKIDSAEGEGTVVTIRLPLQF